jgi:hypothetical protein
LAYVQCKQCGLRSYAAPVVEIEPCRRCGANRDAGDVIRRHYDVLARGRRRPSLFIRSTPQCRRDTLEP